MPGIIDAISIASAHGGGTVNLSVGSLASGAYRVSRFVWTPRMAGEHPPKLQTYGGWPANIDVRELVLDLEGRIVGSDPDDYWDKRIALLEACLPPADYTRTIRHHCTITATPPGQSAMTALATVVEHDVPLSSESGRSSEYRLSFLVPAGYWLVSGSPEIR